MAGAGQDAGVRFGRTVIVATTGSLLDQGVEAVVVAANPRGVMGAVSSAGMPALRFFGGSEIEREAMARAPLELGSAIVTGAAGFEAEGLRAVVHAVVHPALGEAARVEDVRRAVAAAAVAADAARLRSLAFPLLGVDGIARADPDPFVRAVVDELVGCLRRAVIRFERVLIVCRFEDQQVAVAAAIERARARAWSRSS